MSTDAEPSRSLTLPTLIVSISSIDPPNLIIGIALIEVASAFGVSVALAGQIRSATSLLAIAAALVMGALSVHYSYRSLLLAGLLVNLVSAVLCTYAPSFSLLVVCFSATGLVTSLVTPMVFSYIGELYPTERRPRVVGTVASLRTVSYLAMVQLIGAVVERWGWRGAFLFLVAPMAVISLALSARTLPPARSGVTVANTAEGYRGVLASRSALACLLGNMLASGSWAGGVVVYSMTYLREGVHLPLRDASNLFSGLVIGVLVGNYLGGFAASRLGVKRIITASSLITGFLIVGYMSIPGVTLTVAIAAAMSLTAGLVLTCANTLVLGQVPSYRGTVTSLNSAATQLGIALGAAIGGVALSLHGWAAVGAAYGIMHVVAAAIYHLWLHSGGEPGE